MNTRRRFCKSVNRAQDAMGSRDWAGFERGIVQARKLVAGISNSAERAEYESDLALVCAQGEYWKGDLAQAEAAAREAIRILTESDPTDSKGKRGMAHGFLGEIYLDRDQPFQAAEAFRSTVTLAENGSVPIAASLSLLRLSDALLEDNRCEDAALAIERCAQLEKRHFAAQPGADAELSVISMTDPDRNLLAGDFAEAERLFEEKVRFFDSPEGVGAQVDVLRYRLHLAAAQVAQGKREEARATLVAACKALEVQFGAEHPRTQRVRRKLAAVT